MSSCARRSARQQDLPCRVGGEEFTLLLAGTGLDDARQIAERIREAVQVADTPHVEQLYKAKQNGRNRVEVSQA